MLFIKNTLRLAFCCFIFLVAVEKNYAQKKQYQSLLWAISGNGLPDTSYLFGTMHAKEKALFNFSPAFQKAFSKSKIVATEIELSTDMYTEIFSMMMADSNYDINQYLSATQYATLDKWLKKEYGFKLKFFERIKPMFIYVMTNKASMGNNNQPFLDEHISTWAKQEKKEVVGLETIAEQMAALESISIEEQFAMIMNSINQQKAENKTFKKLLKKYVQQDLDGLLKLMQQEEMKDTLYAALIDNRNMTMVNRMLPYMQQQSSFIAVGAGHLPGKQGIISLLRSKGFVVRQVRD